jgi:hypothetical protein
VRDYIQENKMLRKVYEREKDKFGGEKGWIRALANVAKNLEICTQIGLLVPYEYS